MSTEDYKPRKTIDVTLHQLDKLRELLPHGMHSKVFRAIIDDLILVLDECGIAILAPILRGEIGLKNWSPTIRRGIDEARALKEVNPEDEPSRSD